MDMHEEECPNCGSINDIETGENGECERCGNSYVWDEVYDEESDDYKLCLIWLNEFPNGPGMNDSDVGHDMDY